MNLQALLERDRDEHDRDGNTYTFTTGLVECY